MTVPGCRALPESWSESARGEKEEVFRVWPAEAWRREASEWSHLCSRRWRWRYDRAISEGPACRYLHTAKQKLQSWTVDNEWTAKRWPPNNTKSLMILYLTILAFSANNVIALGAVSRWQVTWVKHKQSRTLAINQLQLAARCKLLHISLLVSRLPKLKYSLCPRKLCKGADYHRLDQFLPRNWFVTSPQCLNGYF